MRVDCPAPMSMIEVSRDGAARMIHSREVCRWGWYQLVCSEAFEVWTVSQWSLRCMREW